mmetsp:Transcript_4267/g.8891  ORF Transcript_4267/g.8891 Transcript_4267/m.8891 type:complete len:92 (+) Transcript_4267:488-763(+)
MFCEPYANMTPVPIEGVNFAAFKLVHKYVYGIQLQYNDWQNHSKELKDAADRFGLTYLKLEAEAWFVLLSLSKAKMPLSYFNTPMPRSFLC